MNYGLYCQILGALGVIFSGVLNYLMTDVLMSWCAIIGGAYGRNSN